MGEEGSEDLRKIIDTVISTELSVDIKNIKRMINELIKKNRELFEKTSDGLYREILDREFGILNKCLEMFTSEEKEEEKKGEIKEVVIKLGVVNKDIPKFISEDNFEIGPFKKGDIISIDEKDLELLKNNNYLSVFRESFRY